MVRKTIKRGKPVMGLLDRRMGKPIRLASARDPWRVLCFFMPPGIIYFFTNLAMEIFFFWVVGAFLVGIYGGYKKVSGKFFGSFFLSLIFSPVVGFIIVAVSKPNEESLLAEGDAKKCPDCAELVKADARKCKHCGYLFKEKRKEDIKEEQSAVEEGRSTAPTKGEKVAKRIFQIFFGLLIFATIVAVILRLFGFSGV